jgi:hypothetical protein
MAIVGSAVRDVKGPRRRWRIALLLGLLTAATRLPLIGAAVDVKPDGCEYLGIGRHLAREGAWVSSIKWHFFNDDPPRHFALADRPPLYPLLTALIWRAIPERDGAVLAARGANIALAGLDTALAYLLLTRLVCPLAAFGASLMLAIYPAWMRDSAQPLTEPLFVALWLTAMLVWTRDKSSSPLPELGEGQGVRADPSPQPGLRAPSPSHYALLGLLSGLAYLTRPAGLLLPLFFTLSILLRRPLAPSLHRPVATLWLAFALVWAPYGIAVAVHYGNPLTSILSYNFSIRHIYEGTIYGFERAFPRPLAFVMAQPLEVVELIGRQTATLLTALGRSMRFWLPLVLLLRVEDLSRHRELLLFAGLNFAFHAVSWTVWGAGRYLLPTYLILTAVLLDAAARRAGTPKEWHTARQWAIGALVAFACVGSVQAAARGAIRLHREKAAPHAGIRMGWAYEEAATWLRERERMAHSGCATNQPWIMNLLAEQPARMAPRFRDVAQARRFLERFPVSTLLYFAEEPEDHRVLGLLSPPTAAPGRVADPTRRPARQVVEARRAAPALQDRLRLVRFREQPAPREGGRTTAFALLEVRQ